MNDTSLGRRTLQVAATITLVGAAIFGLDRLRARLGTRLNHVRETSDVYPLPSPVYVERISLGYRDAVASILWASVLYQYGEHVGQNRRFAYATQYVQTILHLDPNFAPAYKFVSTFVTMQAVNPERPELEEVERILRVGTTQRPGDAEVWGAYASFMLYGGAQFLPKGPEREEWRKKGALAGQQATELGYTGGGDLGMSGAIVLANSGYRDLAVQQLERSYAVAPNEETREHIRQQLERMQARSAIDRLNAGITVFLTKWRSEAAFLDETTFVLVGPRPDTAACVGLTGLDPRCTIGWK